MPLKLFYSFSHKDDAYRDSLDVYLKILQRQNILDTWHDRDINAGIEWEPEILGHLEDADIILLLVSHNFIASDYCWDKEMSRALERHDNNEARVIPIILSHLPESWKSLPFAKLQSLPTDARPISAWPDCDKAYSDVVDGIHKAIREMQVAPSTPLSSTHKPLDFDPYSPALPPNFVGRKKELRHLGLCLEQGNSVMVEGDFRIGKTSLLLTGLRLKH